MIHVSSERPEDAHFVAWVSAFNKRCAAGTFYKTIEELPDAGGDKTQLEYQCLVSGYHASIWPEKGQPKELGRNNKENQDAFADSIGDQLRAINTLCNGLSRRGPERHAAALAIQALTAQQLRFANESNNRAEYSVMLSQLLRNYQTALNELRSDVALSKEASFMCIRWPGGRDIPDNSADIETALAFDLLCLLDKHAGNQGLLRNNPTPLDKPQWTCAARLALSLSSKSISPDAVKKLAPALRKFVKRNPGIRTCHWPTM